MSVTVLERPAAIASFAIASEPAQLPALRSESASTIELTDRAMQAIETAGLRGSPFRSIVGAFAACMSAVAAFASFDVSSPVVPLVAGGLGLVAAGVAATGVIEHHRVNRTINAQTRGDILLLEQRAKSADPLDRAIALVSAKRIRDMVTSERGEPNPLELLARRFTVRRAKLDVVEPLDRLVALKNTCTTTELEQAERVIGYAYSANSADSAESIVAVLETLPPEARQCLRERTADKVCELLDAEPGNGWRRARFLEAFDGKRTPYLDRTVEAPALDNVLEPGAIRGSREPVRSLAAAILVAQREFAAGNVARVSTSDLELAKETAHYFEQKGFRAAIRDREGNFTVAIYEAAHAHDVFGDIKKRNDAWVADYLVKRRA